MKKFMILAAVAIAAMPAFAQTKIAVVDMEKVILAHPQTQINKETLVKKQKSFEADRDIKRDRIKEMYKNLSDIMKEANNEALSETIRKAKIEEARDVDKKIRTEEQDLRRLVDDLQGQLQKMEFELFSAVMDDVSAEIKKIAEKGKYDLILDKSGFRAGAPVTIVAYSSDELDITEEVVKAVGSLKTKASLTAPADFSTPPGTSRLSVEGKAPKPVK